MKMASDRPLESMALLARLSRLVYRRADEALLGMRIKEYTSLIYLRDHGESSQQLLAEAMHLDANNCVLLLNDLETQGFAERHRDPRDRRRHLVSITASGAVAMKHAERYLSTVEDEVLAALTAEERATLHQLLARALEGDQAAAGKRVGRS
jgi:DNA-binding MarR family transcriptional regulator